MKWHLVYRKAIENGKLFFPKKLTHEFLEQQKRAQGSYIFSNQYLNEIIPSDLQTFKKEWFRYYEQLPKNVYNFIFVDPALSEADTADYTGVVVVAVDPDRRWYVRHAKRYRVTPTQLIDLLFKLNETFKPQTIGVEEVAFQKALLYFLNEEMRRRGVILPVTGVKPPTDKNKQTRILGALVPRFEWDRVFLARGLTDLELELLQFPRSRWDDLIDALASIELIFYPPTAEKKWATPPHPGHPEYEAYYLEQLRKGKK